MDGTDVGGSLTVVPRLLPLPGPPAVRVEVHLVLGYERDPFTALTLLHDTRSPAVTLALFSQCSAVVVDECRNSHVGRFL